MQTGGSDETGREKSYLNLRGEAASFEAEAGAAAGTPSTWLGDGALDM